MSVINTNVKSLVAQNALTVNGRAMSKTMEQLSTGKRINSAADDAAGLAISNKMTSQIRGLNQGVRNANDGISLIQTAEGALNEVTNMLQRMRELAVQAANDTNTDEDRNYLNSEFADLRSEINRIANNTEFNGMKILNGTFNANGTAGKFNFQVGANSDQTIDVVLKNFTTASGSGAGGTAQQSIVAITGTFAAADDIKIVIGTIERSYAVVADDIGADSDETNANIAKKLSALDFEGFKLSASGPVLTIIEDGTSAGFTPAITATAVGDGDATALQTVAAVAGNGSVSGLGDIDSDVITSKAAADTAIDNLDSAIEFVSQERATMGATINRLGYAADNLSSTSMNVSASRSRIQDTDYAQTTTELARTQIIQQAATAMLAQANQQPSSVLSLLQ